MRFLILIFFIIVTIQPGVFAQVGETDIYVSPEGNDANPGTIESPLLTLRGARDLVRQVNASAEGIINIWFRGGE